jgi:Holliday junction resolvasome RuvABC DNA-binding subunit
VINTLTGTISVEESGPGFITLQVGGIGYLVFVVGRTDVSNPISKFYIHENITAAQQGPSKHDLYGFETQEERLLFRALLANCDRVGPSTAMKVMSVAPPEQLLQAIRLSNEKYISRGVGEKTAQQVILGMGKWAMTEAATKTKELV